MTNELIPCRKCGEQPIYQKENSKWLIGCCHVKFDGCDSLDEAIEMWNKEAKG